MFDFQVDSLLDIARLERDAVRTVVARKQSEQLGEAWIGLDDRRHVIVRGGRRSGE